MKKPLFKNDLKTISIIILAATVISIVSLGAYSGIIMANALTDTAERRAISHLESIDIIMMEKTKNIQRFADLLNANEKLQNYVLNGVQEEVFREINKIIDDFEDVEGCILFDETGKGIIYNLPFINEDSLLKLQVSCSRLSEKTCQLKWFDTNQNAITIPDFENYMLCGTKIYQTKPTRLYIFMSKDVMSKILNKSQGSALVAVLDGSGYTIVSNDSDTFKSVFSGKINRIIHLYEENEGVFRTDGGGKQYVGVHHKSAINNYKYVELYPLSDFYAETYKIIIFMLFLIFLVLCLIAFLYYLLSSRFVKPLNELTEAMRNFDDNSLSKRVPISGTNEVATLSSGFNKMVDRINGIIEDVRQKESAQKQAELMAMRSQIKPHFIYNTLNSVKILASYNKQNEIAKALQRLAGLIRHTFSFTESYCTFEDEINYIKDYIALMQMCYVNNIDVTYDIDEEISGCTVPAILLQPIVENAISHGLAMKLVEKGEAAKLSIRAVRENEKVLIEVTDNGAGISPEKLKNIFEIEPNKMEKGVGIKNISERIKLLYGDAFGLTIKSIEGMFTTVSINLPFEKRD